MAKKKKCFITHKMDYQGILVHDYDVTFYNYGADYQTGCIKTSQVSGDPI